MHRTAQLNSGLIEFEIIRLSVLMAVPFHAFFNASFLLLSEVGTGAFRIHDINIPDFRLAIQEL